MSFRSLNSLAVSFQTSIISHSGAHHSAVFIYLFPCLYWRTTVSNKLNKIKSGSLRMFWWLSLTLCRGTLTKHLASPMYYMEQAKAHKGLTLMMSQHFLINLHEWDPCKSQMACQRKLVLSFIP